MNILSRKGPIFDPGVCRCCGATKKCRILTVEYEWMGQKEVYSDMVMDTFGLLLTQLDGDIQARLICAVCVTRLRDATAFRKQVLQCEEKLMQNTIFVDCKDNTGDIKIETDVKTEVTPDIELPTHGHDDYDDHYADDDVNNVSDITQLETLPVKVSKKLQKSQKKRDGTKKKLQKRSSNGDSLMESRQMMKRIKKMSAKLKRLENSDEDDQPQKIRREKHLDIENKSFQNAITIVANSYVCPFDTSFSDYYCIYCRQIFTDPTKLRDHTLSHDPRTFKDFVSNKKIIQIDTMKIDCRLCPESIQDINTFKRHIINHGENIHPDVTNEFLEFRLTTNNLTCLTCNSTFSYFHALKKHMAEHYGTCICDICGAHYFEERMLVLHQKTHQRIDENYPCKDCGKTFKAKHSRYLHEARTHKKEAAYQCSKCDEVFFSYSLRYRHMIEIHGEERMFQCDHCDRSYDSRKSLREHNRRNHLKIFKHQCDLCDKRFYLPSRLKEHMATHTGERNFRCEYCGKSYPRLRGLKVHMQSHSSEKKYRCVLCNAAFTQNVNLKNHMKRQHQSLDVDESFHE